MNPDERNILEMPSFAVNPEAARGTYDTFSIVTGGFDGIWATFQTIWAIYSALAFGVSAIFIYGIIYSYIKFNEYSAIKTQIVLEDEQRWREMHAAKETGQSRRWREVEEHLQSNNPNDWKLAIIEADVMLERMLEEKGFAGATIADRLRSASGRSFQSIDDAWQAHRTRNQIAHGGSDFVLTPKMAQTAIIQYKRVFEEFGVV